jgi:hypothetical protein
MKKVIVIAAALALPFAASAQTPSTTTTPTLTTPTITTPTTTTTTTTTTSPSSKTTTAEQRLIDKYSDLAGSDKNAKSLVESLRDSKKVTLSDGTTIDPPTKKMGLGNVNIALALAEASLNDRNITNPTTTQLRDTLVGTKTTDGILQMRADGMGWGQIAKELGFKLGEVVGKAPSKSTDTAQSSSAKAERVSARADKPDRPAKIERPDRPSRPDRPERAGK